MFMENKIQALLLRLGVCSPDSISEFYPKVRDRDDIKVMKCDKSGVIFLSRTDHVDNYYNNNNDFGYWDANSRKESLQFCYRDDLRRAGQFEHLVEKKRWLDIGTGAGGLLDFLAPKAAFTCAIEPQPAIRRELQAADYLVYENIDAVVEDEFNVATLFHVIEHLTEPLELLNKIKNKLSNDGVIIIEVPHARDFMIDFLNLESFKAFTFWSEHLILHTRDSLEALLEASGFKNILIAPCQRFTLANHMYWLAKGKPGGHKEWAFIDSPDIVDAYSKLLSDLDKTDTLIAVAYK